MLLSSEKYAMIVSVACMDVCTPKKKKSCTYTTPPTPPHTHADTQTIRFYKSLFFAFIFLPQPPTAPVI